MFVGEQQSQKKTLHAECGNNAEDKPLHFDSAGRTRERTDVQHTGTVTGAATATDTENGTRTTGGHEKNGTLDCCRLNLSQRMCASEDKCATVWKQDVCVCVDTLPPPMLDCQNSVQLRCLEDSFLLHQTRKKTLLKQSLFSTSFPKFLQSWLLASPGKRDPWPDARLSRTCRFRLLQKKKNSSLGTNLGTCFPGLSSCWSC